MDRIRIVGGSKLNGTIPISGAKNAALPLMIAGLLTEETLILDNVPRLADVAQLQRILGNHGVDITSVGKRSGDREYQGQTLHISAADINDTTAPYELVSRMRASFWVIAPLLARMHEAKVSLPGGCAIGTRPVDLLIMALEKLGAELTIDGGYVIAKAPGGLKGAGIDFPKVTVSGTHVALMAATLAKGTTVITNAACEPEILDVADCLNKMGARVWRRYPPHRHRRRQQASRRTAYRAAGSNRDRHLCDGGGDDRRRCAAGWGAPRAAAIGARRADAGRRGPLRPQRRYSSCPQWRRHQPGDGVDRAVSGLSHRSAGAADGIDGLRQGLLAYHRNDFRKSLYACAGTGAVRCADSSRWRNRHHRGHRETARRARDGDGPARLGVAGDRGPGRRRRDHGQPRLPPRPRIRAARGQIVGLRRYHRAHQRIKF